MNPWFLTGFSDAEGCFVISVLQNKELKIGWVVKLKFQIDLHKKDRIILEQIIEYFGMGKIRKLNENISNLLWNS